MSVEKAKVKTAELIIWERVEATVFFYTLMCVGVIVASLGSLILIGLFATQALPLWACIVLVIPFTVLYGIWKSKIIDHGTKRMLEELQIKPDAVIRDLPQPF